MYHIVQMYPLMMFENMRISVKLFFIGIHEKVHPWPGTVGEWIQVVSIILEDMTGTFDLNIYTF
jgi:hypothetical protein